jgi:hypothetical protein
MARQQPTAEQKAKAAERRERFRELVTKVAAMTDDQRFDHPCKVGVGGVAAPGLDIPLEVLDFSGAQHWLTAVCKTAIPRFESGRGL